MDKQQIFETLITSPYSNQEQILQTQKEIYKNLESKPKDIELLILLMQSKIMQGNKEEAKAIANKVWEDITKTNSNLYMLYVNNLINIGLIEMASQCLKPLIEKIDLTIEMYSEILIKFATIVGSMPILNKININLKEPNYNLNTYLEMLKEINYQEQFKEVCKIILSEIKDKIISLETDYYEDEEGTPQLVYSIYINAEDNYAKQELQNKINTKIDNYFLSSNQEFWLAPQIEVFDITEY